MFCCGPDYTWHYISVKIFSRRESFSVLADSCTFTIRTWLIYFYSVCLYIQKNIFSVLNVGIVKEEIYCDGHWLCKRWHYFRNVWPAKLREIIYNATVMIVLGYDDGLVHDYSVSSPQAILTLSHRCGGTVERNYVSRIYMGPTI